MSDDQTSDIRYSRKQEGEAPGAPGFYGSCASYRTMGFARRAGWFRGGGCKRFSRLTGPVGQRILTFDSGFAAEGCGIA